MPKEFKRRVVEGQSSAPDIVMRDGKKGGVWLDERRDGRLHTSTYCSDREQARRISMQRYGVEPKESETLARKAKESAP